MSTKTIAKMILVAVTANCDYPCPAVQKAIDDMAMPFRDGRRGLLEYLRQEAQNPTDPVRAGSLVEYMHQEWYRIDLKRATGRTVEEWGF